MKIVFATRNAGKVRELRLALEGLPITALSRDEAGIDVNATTPDGMTALMLAALCSQRPPHG